MTREEWEILEKAAEIGHRFLISIGKNDPKSRETLIYLAGIEKGREEQKNESVRQPDAI